MSGLPLTNPMQKSINQNQATSATTNRKDPYADMGTMVLSADKRAKESSSSASTRSFLLEQKNGTVVSLEDTKGMKGGHKNPYSEMGVAIDFPEKKSKSRGRQNKIDLLAKALSSPERRMIKKIGDPYSDLGSSTVFNEPKDQTSTRKIESDAATQKKDISEIAANLNKLIEKAQEISSKASQEQKSPSLQGKVSTITTGNATASSKDPYADVGSLTKKSTKSLSLSGTKKDLNALMESPTDEEFASDSEGKSRTVKDSTLAQISGNSVTGLTVTSNMKETKALGTLQGYKKKDPYSDVGSAVDIKE